MKIMNNPYDTLGIRQNAGMEEIKSAYVRLAKEYQNNGANRTYSKEGAEEKMREINEAYDYLTRKDGSSSSVSSFEGRTQNSGGESANTYSNAHSQGGVNSVFYEGFNRGPDRNFYGYNYGRRARNGSCCGDLCFCFALDSCCECMGGDLCPCC